MDEARYLGIGTMTALPEKTVDLAHRARDRAGGGAPPGGDRKRGQVAFPRHHEHELRTPLNAIIGFAELLLMRDVEQVAQRRAISPTSGIPARTFSR